MKKYLLLIPFLFAFSSNSITLKKDKVDQTKNIISGIAKYIDDSNLPHKEVMEIEKQLKVAYDNLSDSTK
jgi:hypothetical protein